MIISIHPSDCGFKRNSCNEKGLLSVSKTVDSLSCLLWTKRWFLTAASIHFRQLWCDIFFVSLEQLFCETEVGKLENPYKEHVFAAEISDYLSFISRTFLLFLSLGMLSPQRFCLFLCHPISFLVLLKDTFLHDPLTSH